MKKVPLLVVAAAALSPSLARAEDQPLSAAEVRKVVEGSLGAMKSCMKKEAPDGAVGKLIVKYVILPTGAVEKPGIDISTTGNAKLDHCIVGVFRSLKFPPPRNSATMDQRYPFTFKPPAASLEDNQVIDTMKAHLGDVKTCYESALKDKPELKGMITVEFTVGQDGKVVGAKKVDSSLGSAPVETCIENKAKTWVFPKPKGVGNVVFSYPFNLTPVESQ
jgi:hypothetical protein